MFTFEAVSLKLKRATGVPRTMESFEWTIKQ